MLKKYVQSDEMVKADYNSRYESIISSLNTIKG